MSGDTQIIKELEADIRKLKLELQKKERQLHELKKMKTHQINHYCPGLLSTDVIRYSRQMLLSQVSLDGQIALKRSKVLIVGMGGLGCPCALYLAAAGVGEITLVDDDVVEETNLHRQILHTECDLGVSKVKSAYEKLKNINSSIKIIPKQLHADSQTFTELFEKHKYNVVVDGTDNVATRYLLNDVCVLNNTPLVSGSALQMEGQLTVYNYDNGPCYRCLFPVPPPVETVTSCGDGGVLGMIPGVIGVLQALETIKIIIREEGVLSAKLLTFDGCDTVFRNIKLRTKNNRCAICGDNPSIGTLIDYEQFCGAKSHDKIIDIDLLDERDHLDVRDLKNKLNENNLLIDVRPITEFIMCKLPNSYNYPYTSIQRNDCLEDLKLKITSTCNGKSNNVLVICRRGNDSQRAVLKLRELFGNLPVVFLNVKGGLHSYSKYVDSVFPIY
nr:adenylyltransferase and sulfurtransferase MOCS3-like [Onthophagus taurus]